MEEHREKDTQKFGIEEIKIILNNMHTLINFILDAAK